MSCPDALPPDEAWEQIPLLTPSGPEPVPSAVVYTGTFFTVHRLGRRGVDHTERYEVRTKEGQRLGLLEWYRLWSKYVLRPGPETIWERTGLHEITDVLTHLTHAQRRGLTWEAGIESTCPEKKEPR